MGYSSAIYGTLYGVTKTTVYLDSDTALALRQMAETQGRSQAELIRDALGSLYVEGKAAQNSRYWGVR